MPRVPLATTALSGYPDSNAKIHVVFRLARRSLLAALLSMLPSCLVDDPPPYTPPDRTPPRLDYHKASPLLDRLVTAAAKDLLTFEIPVASEDAGDELTAQFFVDSQFLSYHTIPPSTLDDRSRSARFSFQVLPTFVGCHRFKILVAHSVNLPSSSAQPTDLNDLAEAYWWANIGLPPGEQGMLATCPNGAATL